MRVSSVGVCLCDDKGKVTHILFGLRNDTKKFTLPGGGIEQGESPLNAAVRELQEEAGLKVDPKQLEELGQDACTSHVGENIVVYAYKLSFPIHKKPLVTPYKDPDKECSKLLWVPVHEEKLPPFISQNLNSKKNVVLQQMGINEENPDKMTKTDDKGGWAAFYNDKWHHVEDVYDSGVPAHQGGGNMYKLKGLEDHVHQKDIKDLAPVGEVSEHLKKSLDSSLNIGKDVEVRPFYSDSKDRKVWNIYKNGLAIGSVKMDGLNVIDHWWSKAEDRAAYKPLIEKAMKQKAEADKKPYGQVLSGIGLGDFVEPPHSTSAHLPAFHPKERDSLLEKVSGSLFKIMIIDFLLGHNNRHMGNFLLCRQHPYLHLIGSDTFDSGEWVPPSFGKKEDSRIIPASEIERFLQYLEENDRLSLLVHKAFGEKESSMVNKKLRGLATARRPKGKEISLSDLGLWLPTTVKEDSE